MVASVVVVAWGGGGGGSGSSYGETAVLCISVTGIATLPYITTTNFTYNDNLLVSRYFSQTADINLTNNGSYVFFNARTGDVLVHATAENLAIVEQVFQLLNKVPPQVQIDSKFASVTQTDTKGVGFTWTLGNMTLNNGAIGAQAGTAPSYQATPTTANPSGIFPGSQLRQCRFPRPLRTVI